MRYLLLILSFNCLAQDFDYQIKIKTKTKASAYVIDLNEEVYRKAKQRHLSDVRVINSSNDLVPMRLIKKNDAIDYQVSETSLPLFKMNQSKSKRISSKQVRTTRSGISEDYTVTTSKSFLNYLEKQEYQKQNVYYLDADSLKGKAIYSLYLDWKFMDKGNRVFYVQVQASNDLQSWHNFYSKYKLMDVTIGQKHLLENKIPIPSHYYSYYRLIFEDFPAVSLKQVRAQLIDESSINQNKQMKILDLDKSQQNSVEWQTGGFFPIESIEIDFKQANIITDVRVYSKARNKDKWRFVSQDSLYSILFEDEKLINNKLTIARSSHQYWKLEFDENVNNESLDHVVVHWRPHQIQFMAQGQAPFTLLIGNDHLKASANSSWYNKLPYDIKDKLFSDQAFLSKSLIQKPKKVQVKTSDLFDKNNQKQWLFWIFLTLIMIVLLRMAAKLLKETKDD